MNEAITESVRKRNRQRSIAISDNLVGEIRKATKGAISVSGFIRMAVVNELEKIKKFSN